MQKRLALPDLGESLITDAERSPSPPPEYDATGTRTNTRAKRTRAKLMQERVAIIGKFQALDPLFRAPLDVARPRDPPPPF